MVVGVGYVSVQLFASQSLKDKRRVVRSVIERTRKRYNASVAEVDYLDSWQMAGIGFSCVSNSSSHVDSMLAEVLRFIEANLAEGAIADVSTELIHMS